MKTALLLATIGLAWIGICLSQRNDAIEFQPIGPASGIIYRSHPLKVTKHIIVHWARDPDYDLSGWCVWAPESGQHERYHLVLAADGETVMATRPEWWKR